MNCPICNKPLQPAPARSDGEPTFVGYLPCQDAHIFLARVSTADGLLWVMFDATRVMYAAKGEKRADLLHRWQDAHGVLPKRSVTRYSGAMRPSELAMTIAEMRLATPK